MSQNTDHIKLLMQALRAGKRLDISQLPEPMRAQVQAQLDKMPPELRQRLLEGAETVAKSAAVSAHAPARIAPRKDVVGHYNQTIQAGDGGSTLVLRLLILSALGLAVYLALT